MSVALKSLDMPPNSNHAVLWLQKLLGKTLRIHLSDGRMMCGTFKCTDKDRNLILSNTHEYRETGVGRHDISATTPNVTKTASNLSTRYIGLITIGGQYIEKVEIEEFDPSSIV